MIGTDDQLKRLNEDIESADAAYRQLNVSQRKVELKMLRLTDNSPIVGKPLRDTDIRHDFYSMLVKIRRGEDQYIQPGPDVVLLPGDAVWVVGDPDQFAAIRG